MSIIERMYRVQQRDFVLNTPMILPVSKIKDPTHILFPLYSLFRVPQPLAISLSPSFYARCCKILENKELRLEKDASASLECCLCLGYC